MLGKTVEFVYYKEDEIPSDSVPDKIASITALHSFQWDQAYPSAVLVKE